MNAPKNIWICAAGKDVPEWVVERMTTAEVATDGSFDIEASDGVIRVEAGFAVFEVGHDVYACAPKGIPEKPAAGDRKSVGEGKSVSVRVDVGGSRISTKKRSNKTKSKRE